MFGDAFQLVAQPSLKPIDGFARADSLDLRPDRPTVDVDVGLRDHWPLHRRIEVLGQSDAGEQHWLMGELSEPADLASRVLGRATQLTASDYLDIEDRCQIWFVSHDFVATPALLTVARAEGPCTAEPWSAPGMKGGRKPNDTGSSGRRHQLPVAG